MRDLTGINPILSSPLRQVAPIAFDSRRSPSNGDISLTSSDCMSAWGTHPIPTNYQFRTLELIKAKRINSSRSPIVGTSDLFPGNPTIK